MHILTQYSCLVPWHPVRHPKNYSYWTSVTLRGDLGEGNGNPLQYSCLENPRDGGAWWAAVSGVTQSRTRLKRLSSSSSRGDLAFCCMLVHLSHFLCQEYPSSLYSKYLTENILFHKGLT